MINVISSAVSGLFIGVLARFFYPGTVQLGWIYTILLGVAGSMLAGYVFNRGQKEFNRPGLLASLLGAMVLIFAGRQFGMI